MSRYDQLRERIINNDELSHEKKIILLKVLDLYLTFGTKEESKKVEDEIYTFDGKVLSDDDRILLEYNRLVKINLEKAEKNPDDEDGHLFFERKVDKFAFTKGEEGKKRVLNEYQLDENIVPSFCSEYYSLLEKYMKLNDISEIDECKFTKKMNM